MSLQAMVWALKTAPVPDPIAHLVLIGLADHAGDDGRTARPPVSLLAEYARCSPRSVQNKLRLLEELGLIMRGDQRMVEHIRADRRPVVWDLDIYGVNLLHAVPRGERGDATGRTVIPDGVHGDTQRGEAVCGQTVLKPSLNRPVPSSIAHSVDFEDFWRVYPRKTARLSAVKAWQKAIKSADPAEILEGARRYADDPNREAKFTAYPATWLNAGRWADEALPAASNGPRDRQGEILQREMAAARAADALELRAIGGRA